MAVVEYSVENAIANMQTRMTQFQNEYLETMQANIEDNYYHVIDSFDGVLTGETDPIAHKELIKANYQNMIDTVYNFTQFIGEAQRVFGETLKRHRDTLSRLYALIYDIENPYEAESPEVQQLMHELRTDFQRELDKVTAQKDAEIVKLSEQVGIWLLDDPHALVVSVEE